MFSQFAKDGTPLHLFAVIGARSKIFVDIGAGMVFTGPTART